MDRRTRHRTQLDSWIDSIPAQPPEQLAAALEQALNQLQLWCRLRLGEQVHAALAHRVLHDARLRFPLLRGGSDGQLRLDFASLADRRSTDLQQLREAGRFMLTELLVAASQLSRQDPMTALESFILPHDGNGNGNGKRHPDDQGKADGRQGPVDGAVRAERRGPRNRRVRPPRD